MILHSLVSNDYLSKVFVAGSLVIMNVVLFYVYMLKEHKKIQENTSDLYFNYVGVILIILFTFDIIFIANTKKLVIPVLDMSSFIIIGMLFVYVILDLSRHAQMKSCSQVVEECILRREGKVLELVPQGVVRESPEQLLVPVPLHSNVAARSVVRIRTFYDASAKRVVVGRIPADLNIIVRIIMQTKTHQSVSFFNRAKLPVSSTVPVLTMPIREPGALRVGGSSGPLLHYRLDTSSGLIRGNARMDIYGFYIAEMQAYVLPILLDGTRVDRVSLELDTNKYLSVSSFKLAPEDSEVSPVDYPLNQYVDMVQEDSKSLLTSFVITDEQV